MSQDPITTTLRDELRAAGLRATASRVAVLRLLRGSGQPLSHGEVVRALSDGPWDRSSLYRNLIDLERVGLLERLILTLGTAELRFSPEVPPRVVINEACELARSFCGEDAVRFVNGVLDRLARKLRADEYNRKPQQVNGL